MKAAADAPGRSLLVLLVMVWGASWPAVKIGVSAMPPVWFACVRYFVATVCAFGFVAVRGELRRPSPSDWRLVAVSGPGRCWSPSCSCCRWPHSLRELGHASLCEQ